MPNTVESVSEARSLVQQLIEKTRTKKLVWSSNGPWSSAEIKDFTVTIPGGFSFTIYVWDGKGGFGIVMIDSDGLEILRVDVASKPRYGYSLPGEQELESSLSQLFELARRDCLEVDKKVNEAKSLLLAL